MNKDLRKFQTLVEIMAKLRAPGGCPWDREQTHKSLAPFAIEEAAELSEAIADDETRLIVDELGDLLLQVVFHAEVGRETGRFTLEDVIEAISHKLIRRHPHVFSDVSVSGADEVLKNWDEIKKSEGAKKVRVGRMDVPLGLPALQRAQKIGDRTRKEKFDWSDVGGVLNKLREEMAELEVELAARPGAEKPPAHSIDKNPSNRQSTETNKLNSSSEGIDANQSLAKVQSELGDVLFTAAQLARHLKLDAEQTLRDANQKFERRYLKMREIVSAQGQHWEKLSDNQKEDFWRKTKAQELK